MLDISGFLRDLEEEELMKSPPVKYRRYYCVFRNHLNDKSGVCVINATKQITKYRCKFLPEFHILSSPMAVSSLNILII